MKDKVIEAFNDAKELVWLDDDEYTVGYNNGIEAGKNITLALLKEQDTVRPVKQIEQTEWTVCGNCYNHIISKWIFCPYCGRQINWK